MKLLASPLSILSACMAFVFSTHPSLAAKTPPPPKPALGTNLNAPDDWNTEIPFVDVFRLSRRWISQQEGQPWGKGPELELDENGWVKKLEPGARAETLLLTVSGHAPAGTYTVLYEGDGKIELKGSNGFEIQVMDNEPGRITFDATTSPVTGDASLFLSIKETNPDDYIRNIRVLLPGHEEDYQKNPFRPGFLEMWKGMAVYRFMDWMKTNNSKISRWEERPKPTSATWTGQGGVPVEVMVDLCNRQGVPPWFCMPHLADDDYVRNFAQLVKDQLDPSLKVYIEYSNEVWNSMFKQHQYAGEQGLKAGYASKPWEAGWAYYARRSVEIFKIWEEVFGGTDRLVRILAAQAENPHIARKILAFEDAGAHADALAIAPYVGFNVPAKSDNPNIPIADDVANWTVERVMDHMTNVKLPEMLQRIAEHKQVADQYGLALIGYEAGQHAVGIAGGENNDQLTRLFMEANRSKAMGELYRAYWQGWQEAGGSLIANFSSIGRWSKWGCWGLMEYYDSKPEDYPKFVETMRWAKSLGQPVNAP